MDRLELISVIAKLGANQCGYSTNEQDWSQYSCDCKYGGKSILNTVGGEQTGCPELRYLHRIFSNMDDVEFKELSDELNYSLQKVFFN